METDPTRSVPCKLMLDSEYSVIKSDVIKSFDCTRDSSTTGGNARIRNTPFVLMLCNFWQQTASPDDIFRYVFFSWRFKG